MNTNYTKIVIAAIAAFFFNPIFSANTNWTWNSNSSTSWTTKGNWTTTDNDASPGGGDTIILNSGFSQYPTLGSNRTVAKVVIDGGLLTYGSSTLTVNNMLQIESGSFTIGNNFSISGSIVLNGGTLNLSNNETIPVSFIYNGGSVSYSTFTLTVSSNLIVQSGTFTIGNNIAVSSALTLNSGILNLNNNETVTGNMTVNGGTVNGNGYALTVGNLLTVNGGILEMEGSDLILNGNADLRLNGGTINIYGADLDANDDVTMTGGTLNISGSDFIISDDLLQTGGTIDLGNRNMTVADRFDMEGGNISNAQIVTVLDLVVNFSGSKTISYTLKVNGDADFVNGILITDNASLLVFAHNASASNADNASHVNGPVRRLVGGSGNTTFSFPVGDGANYAQIEISDFDQVRSADYFTAQYFSSRHPNAGGTLQSGSGFTHVSQAEYWILDRAASSGSATSDVKVRLSFNENTRSGLVNTVTHLRVSRWDGSQWVNHGSESPSGNNATGSIRSSSRITSFSPFTFGSTNALTPLPVKLIDFKAALLKETSVEIKWSTINESNSSYFSVEKSLDGKNWQLIGTQQAAGVSDGLLNYAMLDINPAKGIQFYRLKQVDLDGRFEYSEMISIFIGQKATQVVLFPNPASSIINVSIDHASIADIECSILDASGRILLKTADLSSGIDVSALTGGVYTLRILADGVVTYKTFTKQ